MANRIKFAIASVPRPGDWVGTIALLKSLKQAVESLIGQGKSQTPKRERALVPDDLVTLGLITEEEIGKLDR
jgi:hypothetical protein